MTTSNRKWATSRSASSAVPTLRTVWEASVRWRMRAERTNWSSSTTSTLAMGRTVRHSGRTRCPPWEWESTAVGTRVGRAWCSMARMRRGLVHALAWSLATGAAVTLSWWGVHTVMAGTAYDPPRALPISGDGTPRRHGSRIRSPPSTRRPRQTPTGARRPPPRRPPSTKPRSGQPPGSHSPSATAKSPSPPRHFGRPGRLGRGAGLQRRRAAGSSSTSATASAQLVSATPASGWQMQRWIQPEWIRVTFTRGSETVSVFCTWNGHPPTVEINERTVTRPVAGRPPERPPQGRRGAGEGLALASRHRRRPAGEVGELPAVLDAPGVRVARDPPGQLGDGQRHGRADEHRVAEPLAAQHGRIGGEREFGEDGGGGGDLAAQMRERRPVGEVRGVRPARFQHPAYVAEELGAGQMRRGARPAEHVRDDQIGPAVGELARARPARRRRAPGSGPRGPAAAHGVRAGRARRRVRLSAGWSGAGWPRCSGPG